MKLVTFQSEEGPARLGCVIAEHVYDLAECAGVMALALPSNMLSLLRAGEEVMGLVRRVEEACKGRRMKAVGKTDELRLLAPIPNPPSCRDAYAFRQHVATARRNRGVDMIPEFDQYPVFYFTNHNAIFGPGDVPVESDHLEKLDFELEAAVVIGKQGRNISSSEADSFIAGYTIMNDLSARVLQFEEMKLNLGPAKGKDFATVIGPWLVTPDELEEYKIESDFDLGRGYDLKMSAWRKGKEVSSGNLKDMNWTFAEIIERVSYGVDIFPGDVIGSGTVGTGCFLELNGSAALQAKKKDEEFTPVWLQDGDTIELEITGLGRLQSHITKVAADRSILAKKKLPV